MDGVAVVGQIVDILVSGLVEFGTGIGTALSDIVTSIFFVTAEGATTLSVFGVLIIVFAGISLAIGLSRWVLNFLTSLGNRNS